MAGGFIFGGDTGVQSAEELARRRKLVDALLDTGDVMPRTFGEGLTVFGRAIAGKLQDKKLSAKEDAERARVAAEFAGLTGTSGGSSGGGYTPSGTWTPAPPAPDAVDQMQGTMQGGLSFPNQPKADLGGASGMGGAGLSFGSATMTPQEMLIAGATANGLDPIDVATAISYETGGTFDPTKRGPTTQWGTHDGLIQFGDPQGEKYGLDLSSPNAAWRSQLDPTSGAVWSYLKDAGVQPGMGLDQIYSAINAGSVGRMGASDANNGGAPGTVADKVASMGPHREKAAAFLGGTWTPSEGAVTASAMGGQPSMGMDVAKLAEMASNPYLPEGQRAVVSALLTQAMTPPDPMDALALEKAQLEIDAMKNPKADPMAEIELAQAQLDYEQDKNSKPDPGYVMLTPEEAKAAGLPPGAYQKGADGKIVEIGGDEVTVNAGDSGGTFDKESGKAAATRFDAYVQDGWQAQQMTGDLQTLATLAPMISTGVEGKVLQTLGPMAEALGIEIDGLGEGQAFQSIVDRMAPLMRKPGSGASSDFDAKQFLNSLPKIGNTPEGNAIIMETLSAVQTAKMEAGRIAALAQSGEMTWQEAEKMIREMPDPYAKFKAYSSGTKAATGNTTSSGVTWSVAP